MPQATQDLRIRATRPLDPPIVLQAEFPLAAAAARSVRDARRGIEAVLAGRDRRLLVVVGPCSIHDPAAALEFARQLRRAARALEDDLLLVMRVYFEKPRTVTGWKGLINDPGLDESFQIHTGLRLARKLLLDVAALGLPAGTEFLDTVFGQYYADAVAWGCIGARTVESQVHRELASGLSMPVGFKNRTDGDVRVAVDALRAAAQSHWFPSLTRDGLPAILATSGNPATHLVLRGGSRTGPNHHAAAIAAACALLRDAQLRSGVMVDCSHANSGRDAARQPEVAAEVAAQIAAGAREIIGVMLESNLVGGRQELIDGHAHVPGQSITDACLAWSDTLPVLRDLARAVRARRSKRPRPRARSKQSFALSIRPLVEADIPAVIALWRACGLVHPTNDPRRDIARKLRVRPDLFLVGEAGGRLVATVMVGYEGHRGWINYLGVAPTFRRRGIARRMMAEAERMLRREGCAKINLQVRESNAEVIAFYRAIGFSVDPVTSLGKRLEVDA